jgi:ABC-type Mn2+/Zn2+ transport system permease subunit
VSLFDRALLAAVLLGAACGPLGVWLLAYRHAYATESATHAMLPGLALAAVAGAPLLLGAAGGVVVAAAVIALAARDRRIGGEVAVGVTVTASFGVGALIALTPEAPPALGELLFGDLLGVSDGDLVAAAALAAAVAAALLAGHRPLALAGHDAGAARALGVRPARVEAALLVLLGGAVAVAAQGLGNLLVVALLVAPAVAAGRLVPRLPQQLALAAVLGAGAGALGLLASDRLDVAAGASVALVAVLLALLAVLARPGPRGAATRSPIEALGGSR